MKLSLLGLCVAGAAAILIQTGAVVPVSKAVAAEGCIVTNVALHVRRCPAGAKLVAHSGGGGVGPIITPTAGPPATCIKTNVKFYKNACPVG